MVLWIDAKLVLCRQFFCFDVVSERLWRAKHLLFYPGVFHAMQKAPAYDYFVSHPEKAALVIVVVTLLVDSVTGVIILFVLASVRAVLKRHHLGEQLQ